jgi:hypothetical protein
MGDGNSIMVTMTVAALVGAVGTRAVMAKAKVKPRIG